MNIIFDLDETLIFNGHNPKSSLEGFELVYSPRLSDRFMLRPNTKEAIANIHGMGHAVFLASFSTKNRIEQILRAADIASMFDRVFTRQDLDPCYRDERTPTSFDAADFLLVDDKQLEDKFTQMKLKYFNGGGAVCSDKLIRVSAFGGMDTDTELLTVLKEITTRIQSAGQSNVRPS